MSGAAEPPDGVESGVPSDNVIGQSGQRDAPADSVSGDQRPWLGALAWFAVCVVYAALEVAGLVDGLLLPVPLIAALAVARAFECEGSRAEGSGTRPFGRSIALIVAAGCFPLAFTIWRLRIGVEDIPSSLLALALVAAGAMGTACLCRPVRAWLLPPLGLDPKSAVHTVSAIAFALTFLLAAGDFIELQGDSDETIPLYPSDSLTSFLSDATLALAGVGFLLTRGLRATMARLDLRPIGVRQLVWAVGVAALFHVGVGLLEYAESLLLPTVYALEDRFRYEFVNIPPLVGAVLDSLAAGTGEEMLFRGALQPRVGVVLTALIFAATHVQYQLPGLIMIFLMGLALGFLKQRTSTTFTMCVHVLYDLGAFLLPNF